MNKVGKELSKRKDYRGKLQTVITDVTVIGHRATLAATLIERWGMVAAKPDGEDSAGRQRLALMTPAELVERACATADLAFDAFEERGWLLEVPVPEPDEELSL